MPSATWHTEVMRVRRGRARVPRPSCDPQADAPHETWRDRCTAALTIQREHWIEEPRGYVVGDLL